MAALIFTALVLFGFILLGQWTPALLADVGMPSQPEPRATLGCSVEGEVTLQRAYPQGHSSWITQLRVAADPQDPAFATESMNVTCDAFGTFYFYVTEPGIYDVGVKSAHSLESLTQNVALHVGYNPDIALGTLVEGDADGSNSIDQADLNLLKANFWSGAAATDFNVDGVTNATDYSILFSNFGLSGPLTASLKGLPADDARLQGSVQLVVASKSAAPGTIFELPVQILAGGNTVDAAEMRLAFDPSVLQVVDAAGNPTTVISMGSSLGTALRNTVDNSTGAIRYAAGATFGGAPASGTFTLATIRFRAVALSAGTTVSVNDAIICRAGINHAVATSNGAVTPQDPTPVGVGTPTANPTDTPTITLTPTKTNTPQPSPTQEPSATPTATAEPTATMTPSPIPTNSSAPSGEMLWLPRVSKFDTGAISDSDRFGVNVLGSITDYDLKQLGPVGWYQSWSVLSTPPEPNGIEFVQLIRLREGDYWPPDWGAIQNTLALNPGSLWLIGNEADVFTQDNCTPQQYAERYHECYTFIKQRDPSARVSAGGIVQPTALRLKWLDQARAAYNSSYGMTMPVDLWNIHMQILPERRNGWGCDIPPGLTENLGEDHQVVDNVSALLFGQKVRMFRQWMHDRGEGDKQLIISEYGVLMPSGYGYLGGANKAAGDQMVKDYMTGSFDYCLTATDPVLGYGPDGNRMVQRWSWYSLNDRMADLEADPPYLGFNGGLFDPPRAFPGVLTQFGQHFRDYLATVD